MTRRHVFEFARFLVVGVGNTLVGLTAIFLFLYFGAGDVLANALGYSIGLVFSFFINRTWTFRHSGPLWPAFWRFIAVFAFAYPLNLATVEIFLKHLGTGTFLAQVMGVPPYTITFFLGSRLIAFKERRLQATIRRV
jgi:putative flippase GtrA